MRNCKQETDFQSKREIFQNAFTPFLAFSFFFRSFQKQRYFITTRGDQN